MQTALTSLSTCHLHTYRSIHTTPPRNTERATIVRATPIAQLSLFHHRDRSQDLDHHRNCKRKSPLPPPCSHDSSRCEQKGEHKHNPRAHHWSPDNPLAPPFARDRSSWSLPRSTPRRGTVLTPPTTDIYTSSRSARTYSTYEHARLAPRRRTRRTRTRTIPISNL